jgi:hypothetical protein
MAMSVSRPHAAPSSPQRCAFIGERAATRGRSAREGGGEHAGGKRESPARHANRNARGERREQGHARSSIIYFPAGNDAALIDERAAAGASMSHRAMCWACQLDCQNTLSVTLPIALPLSASAWAFFRFSTLIGLSVCVWVERSSP